MNVSKSQAKRLAIQTEPIDVDLLQNELAMANGHIEWHRVELAKQIEMTNTLGAEVERLQAENLELCQNNLAKQSLLDKRKVSGQIAQVLPLQPQPETVTTTFPKRPQLTRNAAECHNCNTTIESKHRHDFAGCNCDPDSPTWIAVDGGLEYQRRMAGSHANYRDLSTYE